MDSEFPDEDEEFEMRYAEEMEMMNEMDDDTDKPAILPKENEKARKSLNFESLEDRSGGSTPVLYEFNTTRKRQQDEIFGSLSDDDDLNKSGNPLKKSKTNNGLPAVYNATKEQTSTLASLIRPKRYVFRLVPEKPHLSVTTNEGQKLYIQLRSDESLKQKGIDLVTKGAGKLLNVPIQQLKQQVENEMRRDAAAISNEEFERKLRELERLGLRGEVDTTIQEVRNDTTEKTDLWMELYRPQHYLDLLSEEGVNRTLLHWLKLWDKVVFDREVKIRPEKKAEEGPLGRPKPKWAETKPNEKSTHQVNTIVPKKKTDGEIRDEFDALGRPMQRVVLISGPPGLGKTTLAHVVGRHAGYNVVEMNASDDRSTEAFRLQVETSTQMRSVLTSRPEPNCLVIDEIDGAPAASINYLVATLNQNQGDSSKNKTKKKGSLVVCRPIICVCNDLYTPALRPLRQMALVLQFPPTHPTRLAQRLLTISNAQGVKTDLSALLALAEKADYDIRSCLATLYFLKSRGSRLRYADVQNLNIGRKDTHKSLFQVWTEIFHIPRPKRRQHFQHAEREGPLPLAPDLDRPLDAQMSANAASLPARFATILQSVYSCGDYDRLMNGVFENYAAIKFKDSYLSAVCTGLEWICFYDTVNHDIQRTQNYALLAYVPYTFVALHFQFAAVLAQRIQYPTASADMMAKKDQNQNILTNMFQDLSAQVRSVNSRQTLTTDVMPYILPIITPTLRPVSAQLYSIEEKQLIRRVVSVMINYNLTYRQEKTSDGAYRYVLEPDMEQVAYYEVAQVGQRRSLAYAVKQMLAREIEVQKMRLYEASLGPIAAEPDQKAVLPAAAVAAEVKPAVPNHLVLKLQPKAPKGAVGPVKPATDFFGRVLPSAPLSKNADGDGADLWFHFKEGYSNAVRRNVKITDFF